MYLPILKLDNDVCARIRDTLPPGMADVSLFVATEDLQELPVTARGKAFLVNENKVFVAVVVIQEIKELAAIPGFTERQFQVRISLVRWLSQDEMGILTELWWDVR